MKRGYFILKNHPSSSSRPGSGSRAKAPDHRTATPGVIPDADGKRNGRRMQDSAFALSAERMVREPRGEEQYDLTCIC
jgi:hypothetical protein